MPRFRITGRRLWPTKWEGFMYNNCTHTEKKKISSVAILLYSSVVVSICYKYILLNA